MINFYKKLCYPVIIWSKKHLKQVVKITCTLEKTFFTVVPFEGL